VLLATGLGLGLSGMAGAMVVAPGEVELVDGVSANLLTDQPGDPAAGKDAMADRKMGNCLACHVNTDQAEHEFQGEIGPPLDGVAERWAPEELRAILIDSKAVFGDQTVMPAFYKIIDDETVDEEFVGTTILDAQQVEDIVAYLSTLKE
jgi:sulfur-oxidizing protein SoxX